MTYKDKIKIKQIIEKAYSLTPAEKATSELVKLGYDYDSFMEVIGTVEKVASAVRCNDIANCFSDIKHGMLE